MDIPYYALDLSDKNIDKLQSNPPAHERMALATGSLCESDKERLGLCVLLAADEDKFVSKTAKRTLESWDAERLSNALHRQSHAKVIEYVVEFLPPDEKLDQTLFGCVNINDRSALLIAQRATERTCIEISKNRQQLLLNPALLNALKQNANCPEDVLSKTENFLRLQQALPSDDSVPIRTSTEASGPSADIDIDIAAEVTAALNGERSPFLNLALSSDLSMFALDSQEGGGDFSFDFNEGSAFNFDVEGEADGERKSMEQIINEMSIGHKIKLAYKGNKEARSILVRDTNKSVAVAVVKSGRMTDTEVASYAGNRNLCDDVIREIARTKEFTRKYPVQVALVNNPKTPVNVAISLINSLHKKDLQSLTRNRNVSSVIAGAARKRFRDKYRKS